MWVNLGGTWRKMKLCISLSVVSGDQKLQDCLCGRKASNNGSAGRVHHGCMASAIYATAVGVDDNLERPHFPSCIDPGEGQRQSLGVTTPRAIPLVLVPTSTFTLGQVLQLNGDILPTEL